MAGEAKRQRGGEKIIRFQSCRSGPKTRPTRSYRRAWHTRCEECWPKPRPYLHTSQANGEYGKEIESAHHEHQSYLSNSSSEGGWYHFSSVKRFVLVTSRCVHTHPDVEYGSVRRPVGLLLTSLPNK